MEEVLPELSEEAHGNVTPPSTAPAENNSRFEDKAGSSDSLDSREAPHTLQEMRRHERPVTRTLLRFLQRHGDTTFNRCGELTLLQWAGHTAVHIFVDMQETVHGETSMGIAKAYNKAWCQKYGPMQRMFCDGNNRTWCPEGRQAVALAGTDLQIFPRHQHVQEIDRRTAFIRRIMERIDYFMNISAKVIIPFARLLQEATYTVNMYIAFVLVVEDTMRADFDYRESELY